MHSAGGTLLQHLKEHRLHADIRDGDRVFYFTTCGWMMWNWLASGLASGATLLLYDGSPFHPDGNVLFDFAEAERMTYFGTSAKFIDAAAQGRREPDRDARPVDACARSPRPARRCRRKASPTSTTDVKSDVHLASISGGTDIVSCFVLGVPTEPVCVGEIQGARARHGGRCLGR